MRDLSLGETGGVSAVPANGRQVARVGDGRWIVITDVAERVTGRASVVIRVSAGAVPLEDVRFGAPIELAGNLTVGLLGEPLGPADQGSIVVDSGRGGARRVAPHGPKRDGDAVVRALRDRDPADRARWHGLDDGECLSRVDRAGRGPASLGDIVVTADGSVLVAYSQGATNARRVVLARPAAGGWRHTSMTERWDYGDPVLDMDERGAIHLAYGPDPRSYADRICSVDFGEFEEEFLRDPGGIAERSGIYYTQSRDGEARTRADGRTPGAELVAYASDHPTIAASRGTILIGCMARGNWPGMVDRVFYSSYRTATAGTGRWQMHVNLNRDESQEVACPTAFVDRYGQPRLAWVNRERHHVFMSRWMGGGMAAPQGIRWGWELAPALSVEKRMPAGSDVFGLLYLTADGEMRFGRVEVPAIDPRRRSTVLFLDLWELAERRHVDLVVNTAKKDPRNPVRQGEPGSWDAQAICYGTVLYDEGRYRMWYTARSGTTDCAVCGYAVSDDGITWERPNLGLFAYAGTRQPNLIGHPATHYVIEDATHGQTGLARVPVDGWTYLRVRSDRSAGSVTTNPIAGSDLSGLDLTVKADHLRPGRDYLTAELIGEPDGVVLPGFAAAESTPVDTDGDAAIFRWGKRAIGEAAAAAAVRIRFHLMGDGARFYCFGFRAS